jgi:polar amino acid transport system substrate-binding protein
VNATATSATPAKPVRRWRPAVVGLALLPLTALTACGSAGGAGAGTGTPSGVRGNPVAAVRKADSVAALLPASVRASGVLRVGSAVGGPPSAYFPAGSTGAPVGLDIDITDAVAKVLGVTVHRETAAFEAVLPALGSGKYDVGTGNFGVTTARLRTIDFVTYVDDGQGFAVRKGSTALGGHVTRLTQLCGLTVGTSAGTTFESTLEADRGVCAAAGRKPYQVKVFTESAALLTALQQGRVDVEMSATDGLRYQASQPAAGTAFLGEYRRLDVGFAFAKGSPLTGAFRAAVDKLIADGTYARILRKWGVTASAVPASRVNPPERS